MNVQEIATDSLRFAKSMDHAESYVVRTVTHSAYIDGDKISNIESKIDSGMSVRVALNNKLGRACVTLSDKDSAASCVETAIKMSSFSPENSGFKGYPIPSKPSVKVKGIFDKRIENAADGELKEILSQITGSCWSEIPRGLLRLAVVESAVANSNGVLTAHKGTMMYGHFTSMFRGDRNGEGTESVYGVSLSIEPECIGLELDRKARASASAGSFNGKETMTMILPPCELGDMIMSSAGSALNGENVFYRQSAWTEMLGNTVASDCLTMTDDPSVPGPLCSQFDDEGTPAQRKVLIEKGVLKTFIRDSFIGESTGNGLRRNETDPQNIYNAAVSIKPMNMIISPGRYSQEDIISQTDNGILVEKFAWPEADPLTGRFGLEVRCGHIIRKGKITGVVNNALLMGNMFDALKNIQFVGNNAKNTGCVTVPAISFSGVELVGN